MLALPIHRGCGRLLVTLALTMLGLPGSVANGPMARAQEISPPPVEEPKMPRQREFDDPEVERLFREYERLTVRTRAATTGQAARTNRPRGDFWTPGELRRIFGR